MYYVGSRTPMNPHQYEGSLAQKSLYISGVAGIISILSGICVLILFFLRHEHPHGWSMAWEPAILAGVSILVSIIAFLIWALDSYGYFDNFFDLTGEHREPPNPFC